MRRNYSASLFPDDEPETPEEKKAREEREHREAKKYWLSKCTHEEIHEEITRRERQAELEANKLKQKNQDEIDTALAVLKKHGITQTGTGGGWVKLNTEWKPPEEKKKPVDLPEYYDL